MKAWYISQFKRIDSIVWTYNDTIKKTIKQYYLCYLETRTIIAEICHQRTELTSIYIYIKKNNLLLWISGQADLVVMSGGFWKSAGPWFRHVCVQKNDLDTCNSIWQTNPAEITGYEFWAQKKVKVKVKYPYLPGFIVIKNVFLWPW